MPEASRLKKSLLNARVNLIFYFLNLALSFFSRKIFLDTLGADFMGLIGTMNNLLGFLNLAELGISTAIGYVLYKPLFEHNEPKINEIISVFGFIYRRIGFIILSAGCVLACFMPLIFPNNVFDLESVYFAFFSYLTTSLIGYFANYKQTLLGADQRNYVVTAYYQSAIIVKTLLQMALVYYTGNYYLWISMELLLGVTYSIILNWKVNQVYPWLRSEIKQGKLLFKKYPEVIKYTKQLFVHKIGGFVQFQTTPFLVYAFVSLKTVAYYGNYTLIIDKISIFISNLLGSTNAGVGNLIAEGNPKRILQVFWELMGIRFLIAGTISFALLQLTDAFISLWLGNEYIISRHILYLIILNSFIGYTRGATDQFIYGYGLFQDTWAPVAEVSINLIVAIVSGYFWGLPGILMGNITSLLLIIVLWKPYFLYSKGFKMPIVHYWIGYIKHLIIISLPAIACYFLLPSSSFTPEKSFAHWIIYGAAISSAYGIMTYALLFFLTPGIRAFTYRAIKRKR
ncbi:O-antigen/teichoic acid export membrane protein [Bacteroides zoogleoformans]|uniref:Sugar transporter n=1 Tax=Bacteroides zoogleoformans TaxID=28119 RepID=A0ABM6T5V6_9BACE|nr:sugar transporter [Bacteroides zoogleoformans]AVM52049.1 sugar transporter [Bacteroides zoogleoformans]TWJ13981.1 O-antigen/teichoic acid export membrane protein [Bacteroides zoogleoformans]